MDGIKHSNQIFLFQCMQQLTNKLSNFSRMQMEKIAHMQQMGRMREWASG
jgi:DNA polymerase III psi subunit